jgi:PAS domain S-box-containing protein
MTRDDLDLDVTHALEEMSVAAYVVDPQGRIRWLNRGAIDMLGDRTGQHFSRIVAREDLNLARAALAKKLIGEEVVTEYTVTVIDRQGRRVPVHVSSVPLCRRGEVIGVFGVAYPARGPVDGGTVAAPAADAPELTARKYETLALLADGLGTAQIAERLGVAEETARNHIRGLLRQLDAHSRLQAVVRGYRLGLLQPRREE